MKLAIALAACLTLAAATNSQAAYSGTESVSSGAVSATLTYEATKTEITNALTITRAGSRVFQGAVGTRICGEQTLYCAPFATIAGPPSKSLTVTDLDDDNEPEVIVDIFTGGAHCCTVSEIRRFVADRYTVTSHSWGNVGYRLQDLDGDGRPEFVSGDDRFSYAFAAYAFSGRPIRILHYEAARWRVVTKLYRSQIQRDAAEQWKSYRKVRKTSFARGFAAAWAADQYMLGRRTTALKTLKRAARRGELRGPATSTAFLRTLDRQLRHWGY